VLNEIAGTMSWAASDLLEYPIPLVGLELALRGCCGEGLLVLHALYVVLWL